MSEVKDLNLEVVKGFFESNKDNPEIQQFKQSLVSPDLVESFLGSEDGKKIIQPKLDKHFTKGLETWKQNNLNALLEEEINKRFPPETEEKKQLRMLQQELENIKREKQVATIMTETMKALNEKGLPVEVADLLVSDSIESTRDKLNSFEKMFNNAVKAEVDKRLKSTGGTPKNEGQQGSQKKMTKEEFLNLDYVERARLYNENPEEYSRLLKG